MLHATLKATLLSAAASTLLLAGCHKQSEGPDIDNTPQLRPLTSAETSTVASANDFAFQAFGAVRRGAETSNVCISPLSISAALTMAYNGADGTTKAAMKQTLGFAPQTDAEINASYQSLFSLLAGIDKTVAFTSANSIWYDQKYQLQAPFVQLNQTYFGAPTQALNFTSPTAKDAINDWVAAQTQRKITSIVEQTSGDDVMYLVNALYFKGSWTYRFEQEQTRPAPFKPENAAPLNVDFMHLTKGKYRYYADAQQQVIDLPYGNQQFSMTLVVPQGPATLADVTQHLSRAALTTWLAAADTTSRELRLPKFKLEYNNELSEALTQLGMGVAFAADQADFSRMLNAGPKDLHISKVQHKTFIEVDEDGTTAAAVTSVGMAVTTSLPAAPVLVDRPFVFLIREKSSNAILFIGQLVSPQ